jgi:hypothetical protein
MGTMSEWSRSLEVRVPIPVDRNTLDDAASGLNSVFDGYLSDFLLGIDVASPDEVDPEGILRDRLRELYWESFQQQFPAMSVADRKYLGHLCTFLGCVTRKVWEVHGRKTDRPTVKHLEIARATYSRVARGEFLFHSPVGPIEQINEPCPFCAPDPQPTEKK